MEGEHHQHDEERQPHDIGDLARPHRRRPAADRFFRYVGAMTGVGTDAYRDRDTVDDIAKVCFAGLTGARIKSASRLKQLIAGGVGSVMTTV